MDYLWVAVAFICGFLVRQLSLPPLVGYLAAGFGLHALGIEPDSSLDVLADLGVSLLLFTIGLKLNVASLFKTEIWGSATGHMSVIVAITMLSGLFFGLMGVMYFAELNWQAVLLVSFAMSFSSTVCAVKVLEDKGELRARHGQVAIGILIIQDIAAVLFVTFTADQMPSLWALALLGLPLLRPLLFKLIQRCGHGEVLPLVGFFLAFSGAELFELVGLKSQLGALVAGILLSGHCKSAELAKSLLSFKDIFLIGFFLSVGFIALPTLDMLVVALILTLLLPIKTGLFFLWLTRLKLRSRSAFLSALTLSNYSEFGLIVGSVSVTYGLLPKEWLVIMALAVAISFIFSSIINIWAHDLFQSWVAVLKKFEGQTRLAEDHFSQPHNASVLVIGMGRVGTGAYDTLTNELNKSVCGIDVDKERVAAQELAGRNVIAGDAEDPEFWAQIDLSKINLILFAIPNYVDMLESSKQLRLGQYKGKTAAVARYVDEEKRLLSAGVDVVFNYYAKVGTGFAEATVHLLDPK